MVINPWFIRQGYSRLQRNISFIAIALSIGVSNQSYAHLSLTLSPVSGDTEAASFTVTGSVLTGNAGKATTASTFQLPTLAGAYGFAPVVGAFHNLSATNFTINPGSVEFKHEGTTIYTSTKLIFGSNFLDLGIPPSQSHPAYSIGDEFSWAGSGKIDLGVGNVYSKVFNPGTYSAPIDGGNYSIIVHSVVPEPTSFLTFGFACTFLLRRRRPQPQHLR